ncbi:chromosome partitioning protein ParB [Acidovorax sp. NCPPB 4044]|uniref:chromosome partitioning protein ParB n=1 Tax=Acidovorax sp. NCPPB 4044 TaxID=2940490 RepID=UPI002302039D|nr:chromosome partitioning protein ParB [Acidovorax sp. NCPPB 4044]MDA8520141.1 chromosome partitioning protein ParB [Acidovorax sp. NCPPB 4044]
MAGSDNPKHRRAPIGRRPAPDPATAWVHREEQGSAPAAMPAKGAVYTARLTIDVTPALRGRIKVIAFRHGITAADMLRELLEREYPEVAS